MENRVIHEQVTTTADKKAFRSYLYWASFQANAMSFVKIFGISAVLALLATFFLKKSWTFFGIWTAIIAVVYTLAIVISNEITISKAQTVKNFSYLCKEATYNFYDNCFTTSISNGKYSYRKIFQLFATKNLLVINYDNAKTFLIRKADMEEGQLEKIVEIMKKKNINEGDNDNE